jgi:cytochrome c heme-lyase
MGQSPSHPPSNPNPPSQCPVHSSRPSDGPTSHPPQCPVHSSLNRVPSDLPQTPHHSQSVPLPTHRTFSSIPRSGSEGRWEYPSPQQFYHALMRKGWETPTESVEVMVEIHNFLNEKAWEEVRRWERRVNVYGPKASLLSLPLFPYLFYQLPQRSRSSAGKVPRPTW